MDLELSVADVRRLAVAAQGLNGRRHRDPLRLLRGLSAVQIDTISVIARSHELVAFSRLGPVSRTDLARAWWGRGKTFEYWAHAARVAAFYPRAPTASRTTNVQVGSARPSATM